MSSGQNYSNGHGNGHSNGNSNGQNNGNNGYTNGKEKYANGYQNGKVAPQKEIKPLYAKQTKPKKEGALAGFKKLRQASKRPLPTERGDGSYRVVQQRPKLSDDLKRLSLASK